VRQIAGFDVVRVRHRIVCNQSPGRIWLGSLDRHYPLRHVLIVSRCGSTARSARQQQAAHRG